MSATSVQTVLGPVDVTSLGVTLVHEHIFMGWPGWDLDPLAEDAKTRDYPDVVSRLRDAAAAGVRTLIDATPADLGRDVALLRRVSQESGINIVASTGVYHEAWGFPVYLKMRSVEELASIFHHELTQGIDGTDVRAGVIKLASNGATVGRHELKALRAAAVAAVQCRVPVITHAANPAVGLEQARTLTGDRVEPCMIQIGHCDSFPFDDLIAILATGVTVGFDQIVYPQKIDQVGRVASLSQLIDAGYLTQLTLSQDQIGILGGRPMALASATRAFTDLTANLIPALRASGVTEDAMVTMMVTNPSRLFGDGPSSMAVRTELA